MKLFETNPFCHAYMNGHEFSTVNKRLRNLGQIQFISKSSSLYTQIRLSHKYQTILKSWLKVSYNFHREHILLKMKIRNKF